MRTSDIVIYIMAAGLTFVLTMTCLTAVKTKDELHALRKAQKVCIADIEDEGTVPVLIGYPDDSEVV